MIRAGIERFRFLRRMARMELAFPRRAFRPGLWAKGFFSQRAWLYDFACHGTEPYLSDWEVERRLGRVNDDRAARWLDDKLLFHLLLQQQGRPGVAAPLAGVAVRGEYRDLCGAGSLAEALARLGPLVAKPATGAGGRGVHILRRPEGLATDGEYVLEGFLAQHAYAAAIFPGALNTIRVITLVDEDGPFIAAAAHRFGVTASAPADNFKRGGLSALVDLETGVLSRGRTNPGLHAADSHPAHPETGAPVEGVAVPQWDAVKRLALDLAALVPGLRHVGWDLCVTPDGPRVVEGNSRLANPNLVQAHRPLLLDARTRAFLWRHGVLGHRRYQRLEALLGR